MMPATTTSILLFSMLQEVLARAIGQRKKNLNLGGRTQNISVCGWHALICWNPFLHKGKKIVRTNKMNSANLQDIKSNHRSELHFYTLAVNNMESKLRKRFVLQ